MPDVDSAREPEFPHAPSGIGGARSCCRCAAELAAGAEVCPACGAECAPRLKTRRRSRSVHVRPRSLARSALSGALITVIASAILNMVVTAMAEGSMPAGSGTLPLAHRLYYAGCTLAKAMDMLFSRLLGGLGTVAIVALAGAAVGVLFYLIRSGYWRSRSRHNGSTPSRRRRSR